MKIMRGRFAFAGCFLPSPGRSGLCDAAVFPACQIELSPAGLSRLSYPSFLHGFSVLAGSAGFEPAVPPPFKRFGASVFKTAAISRSASFPYARSPGLDFDSVDPPFRPFHGLARRLPSPVAG